MKEPKKILIVEDEDNHYELIQRGLEKCADVFHLERARSLHEAWQKIHGWTPDLVMTDLKLPDGDGIALISKDPSGAIRYPVVVMTSHGNEDWAVNAMKLGALDYIVKSSHILANMERVIQRALREWSAISERNRAEDALRYSEQKYRVVADNTYDWEFWIAPDNHFLYTSPSCEKITGHPAGDFEKDPDLINRIVHSEDGDVFRAHRHTARDLKEPQEVEFRIMHPDGSIRWIGHNCQPVLSEQGRFIGTRGSNRDITARKNAEQEREQLIQDLQRALEKVKTLSGMLPICASCKKIKDDEGYWQQIEVYVSDHSMAEFSHGLCPECAKKLYPQYYKGE